MATGLEKQQPGVQNHVANCLPNLNSEATEPRTILLVEDEAFVRDVMDEALQSVGYRVLKTQNAEEALQLYQSWHGELNLLLTDVVMPGQNGRELARQLRMQCPSLRTIFMSGYGESMALLGAERDANVFYLSKPFSLPGLLKKVKEVLKPGEAIQA
jgi:two-component system, cell cycle sensor histidine kinase and response regulator CckA